MARTLLRVARISYAAVIELLGLLLAESTLFRGAVRNMNKIKTTIAVAFAALLTLTAVLPA